MAALLALASCSSGTEASGGLPPLPGDPGPLHVHGLGVDPASGDLYAATHTGLFRIVDGTAQRVANRAQDTMGFTVVGPSRFLGSGHPDGREDPDLRPPHLGLIESEDAGLTWQSRSLRGEADFHVLHRRHERTYGYDATSRTLMVSTDNRRWDRRAVRELLDFEVSPLDPDALLATDGRSLLRSSDGGRTWQPAPDGPALTHLAWDEQGDLYGATADGSLLTSPDSGRSWSLRARGLGEVEALEPGGDQDELYLASSEKGILRSADGGRTYTVSYRAAHS